MYTGVEDAAQSRGATSSCGAHCLGTDAGAEIGAAAADSRERSSRTALTPSDAMSVRTLEIRGVLTSHTKVCAVNEGAHKTESELRIPLAFIAVQVQSMHAQHIIGLFFPLADSPLSVQRGRVGSKQPQ
jgi:hypothetical protein